MKRIIALSIVLILLLGLCACGAEPADTTAPAPSEADILAQRRQTVMDFMRSQLDFYWRCEETMEYVNAKTGELELTYYGGQVYRGLPYGQSGGTAASFMRHKVDTDEKGLPVVGGLTPVAETGKLSVFRMGSDCAATVWTSWSQVSSSISAEKRTTKYMTTDNGFLRVGEYESASDIHADTKKVCKQNGEQVMFEAYAQLQPGDACVHFNGTGHAIMITEVTVKRNPKTGEILGNTSFVKLMDQTSGEMNDDRVEFVEELEEEVHIIGNVEKVRSFSQLFSAGYLPVTCRELIDPSPLEEETLELQQAQSGGSGLAALLGDLTAVSNRAVNVVHITVSDGSGVVQECSMVVPINALRSFNLGHFLTEPAHLLIGALKPEELSPGTYTFTCTATSVTGMTITFETEFDQ